MIDAIYFDGESTRRQQVVLMIHKRILALSGEGVRHSVRLSKVTVSERLEHAPRILRLPGGGTIEVSDRRLDKMLRKNGYREPRVVKWQRNWPLSLLALISLLATLIAGYQWGLPWAADRIAQHLPASLEKKIGDEELKLIDATSMEPSRLDPTVQARLRQRFAALKQPRGEKTPYRLEFRYSKIGPNAFALPNGVIIMTDQLVNLANDDHAVLGVLGHELGHVERRHSLRRLLQTVGVGMVINLWIGDVSSVLAAIPTFLLDQKYSRDFEREADQYAIDMMQANALPLSPMAHLFEKMGAMHQHEEEEETLPQHADSEDVSDEEVETVPTDEQGEQNEQGPRRPKSLDYLNSHPSDAERIARLRAADAKR